MTLVPSCTFRLFLALAVTALMEVTTAFAPPLTTTKTTNSAAAVKLFGLGMRSDESEEFRGDCHDFDYYQEGRMPGGNHNMPAGSMPGGMPGGMPFGPNNDHHHQDAPFFDQPPPFGHEMMPNNFGHGHPNQQDDFFMSQNGPNNSRMQEAPNPNNHNDGDYEQFLHQQHMELQEFFEHSEQQQDMPQQMMREIPMPPPMQQQHQQQEMHHQNPPQDGHHPNTPQQQQQGEVNIQALVTDATAILKADHRVLEVLGHNFHLLQDSYVAHQEGPQTMVFDVRFVMERKGAFVSNEGGTVHVVTDPTGIVQVLLQPDQNSGAPLEVHLGQHQQDGNQSHPHDGSRRPPQQHPQGHAGATAAGSANSQQSSSSPKDTTVIDVEILEELKELKKKYPEM